MPGTPLTVPDIVGYVLEHTDEDDLRCIADALKSRHLMLRQEAAAVVRPGARITIRNIKPKYLDGLTGTVTAIELSGRTRSAVVSLDVRSTRELATSRAYAFLADRDSHDIGGIPLVCCHVTGT